MTIAIVNYSGLCLMLLLNFIFKRPIERKAAVGRDRTDFNIKNTNVYLYLGCKKQKNQMYIMNLNFYTPKWKNIGSI